MGHGGYYPRYYSSYARPYCYGRSYGYGGYYGGYYPYSYGYGGYGYGYPSVSFSYTSVPSTACYRSAPASSYNSGGSLEADVQRQLRRLGYYDGAIDGDIGPASRSAIRGYQDEHGLEPTGRIDARLLRALGL